MFEDLVFFYWSVLIDGEHIEKGSVVGTGSGWLQSFATGLFIGLRTEQLWVKTLNVVGQGSEWIPINDFLDPENACPRLPPEFRNN